MFPSKNPLLCIAQVLVVGFAVIAALIVTGNPLALFGLLLIWDTPPLVPENYQNTDATAEQERSTPIGFTTNLDE